MQTNFNPEDLGQTELHRIRSRSARNVSSEVVLILTAGFAFMMVFLFFLGQYTFLPIAELLGIRPILAWISLSVLLSVCLAFAHAKIASKTVALARAKQFEIDKFVESKKRAEIETKIAAAEKTKRTPY